VPAKPRLIARSNDTKTPWKTQKIPAVSSNGLTEHQKALFGCILWRMHECEKNPLQPEQFKLLIKDREIGKAAQKLGIPVITLSDLKSSMLSKRFADDQRLQFGQLESDFGNQIPEIISTKDDAQSGGLPDVAKTYAQFHTSELRVESSEITGRDVSERSINEIKLNSEVQTGKVITRPLESENALPSNTDANARAAPTNNIEEAKLQLLEAEQLKQGNQIVSFKEPKMPVLQPTTDSQDMKSEIKLPQEDQKAKNITAKAKKITDSESELGSDEEIIVFNPRARRASNKKAKDAVRSRPTSSGLSTKPKIAPGPSSRPSTSAGTGTLDGQIENSHISLSGNTKHHTSNSLNAIDEHKPTTQESKLKPYLDSKLKAESPVFTPGKPFVPLQQQATNGNIIENESKKTVESQSPPTQPRRTTPPRQPRAAVQQQRNQTFDQQRAHRESQRIIQRQREAIQRQAKAAETQPKIVEKSPPRQIKMEPTDKPTMIDPDVFDRSYVLQPPSKSPSHSSPNEKRGRNNKSQKNRGNSKANGKRNERGTDSGDVEFVLKSGAPRGSLRGKGKLWEPGNG
jgi:hypothetical protein